MLERFCKSDYVIIIEGVHRQDQGGLLWFGSVLRLGRALNSYLLLVVSGTYCHEGRNINAIRWSLCIGYFGGINVAEREEIVQSILFVRLRGRLAVHVWLLMGGIREVRFAACEVVEPKGAHFMSYFVVPGSGIQRSLNPAQCLFRDRILAWLRLRECDRPEHGNTGQMLDEIHFGREAHPFCVVVFPIPKLGCPVLALFARAGTMLPIL
jgi:hypothetical protein